MAFSYEIKGGEWMERGEKKLIRKFSNKKLAEFMVRQLNAASYGGKDFWLKAVELAEGPEQFDFAAEVYKAAEE